MRPCRLRRSTMATAASRSALPVATRERRVDRKPVAVLHQHMTYEAEPALAAVRLAIEPRVGIGSRSMRLIRALLLVEIALAVAFPDPAVHLSRNLAGCTSSL